MGMIDRILAKRGFIRNDDKTLEQAGFVKSERLGEVMSGGKSSGAFSILGTPEQQNWDAYLKSYADVEWIFACVTTISHAIAGLPLGVFKERIEDKQRIKEEQFDGEAVDFLEKPCKSEPSLTLYNILDVTSASLELAGNAYWLQEGDNKPTAIIPLIASRVKAIPNDDDNVKRFVKEYKYNPTGISFNDDKALKPYKPELITHFKYMNPVDYIYGIPPLSACRNSKQAFQYMTLANINIFKKASLTDIFLKTDKVLNQKVYNRLLETFHLKHTGVDNAHSVGILEQGLSVQEVRANLRDLEYDLGRRITREEICSVFGVPPLLVGILDKATYSNYKESIKIFYQLTIIPKLKRIEPLINNLIQKFDKDLFVEFDLSVIEALRDDELVKAQIGKIYFDMGVPVSIINDKLNLGLAEYDGWDVGYISVAMVPNGSVQEEPAPEDPNAPKEVDDSPYAKTLGKEWKLEKWSRQTRLMDKVEAGYKKAIKQFFFEQRDGILKRLDTKKDADVQVFTADEISAMKTNGSFPAPQYEKSQFAVDSVLFREEGEIVKWAHTSKKFHALALAESAKQELIMLGIATNFNMNSAVVVNWLAKNGLAKATSVVGSARDDVRNALLEGMKNGEGVIDLKKRVMNAYDGFSEDGYKAQRIARTEVTTASNEGVLQSYKQSGVIAKKGWINEPNARDSHLLAGKRYGTDATAIPVGDDFELTGGSGQAPCQIGAPEEDINCRCTMFAVLKKRDEE